MRNVLIVRTASRNPWSVLSSNKLAACSDCRSVIARVRGGEKKRSVCATVSEDSERALRITGSDNCCLCMDRDYRKMRLREQLML
eukprot:106990-Amphidinium_carterae.1